MITNVGRYGRTYGVNTRKKCSWIIAGLREGLVQVDVDVANNSQQRFQSFPVFVVDVRGQRVEGISKATLSHELQSGTPHPVKHVDLCDLVADLGGDRRL